MIRFRGVNKWFGPLHVLKDVDLDVRAGEVLVVCGPSGSGKSTLIRCINKLEPIQKGDIVVDGMSLSDPATDVTKLRAEVGMVFQQFNLYPHMTALGNVVGSVMAGLAARYLTVRQAVRADAYNTAGRLALLLLEGWRSTEPTLYDPTSSVSALSSLSPAVTIVANVPGCPAAPTGFTTLNTYRVIADNKNFYVRLSYKPEDLTSGAEHPATLKHKTPPPLVPSSRLSMEKAFNMIVLGAFLKLKPIVELDNVIKGLKKSLPERHHHTIGTNRDAIVRGMEIVRQQEEF